MTELEVASFFTNKIGIQTVWIGFSVGGFAVLALISNSSLIAFAKKKEQICLFLVGRSLKNFI